MPKMRGIKPQIWTDDRFCSLSPHARLLFIGMWHYACDNGHVEDAPRQLRRQVLPDDVVDADALVDELVASGMVTRGGGWLTVVNLGKHQKLDARYFTTCDCPGCVPSAEAAELIERRRVGKRDAQRRARGEHTEGTSGARGVPDGHTPGARGVPVVVTACARVEGEGEGEGEGEVEQLPNAPRAARPAPADAGTGSDDDVIDAELIEDVPPQPDPFDTFWRSYPERKHITTRAKARAAWARATKKTSPHSILAAVDHLNDAIAAGWVAKAYVPNPTRWLNEGRWEHRYTAADRPRSAAEVEREAYTRALLHDDTHLAPTGTTGGSLPW